MEILSANILFSDNCPVTAKDAVQKAGICIGDSVFRDTINKFHFIGGILDTADDRKEGYLWNIHLQLQILKKRF